MRIYVIFRSLAEYPDKIVVYAYTLKIDTITRDPKPIAVCDSLSDARAAVPKAYNYRIPRQAGNDAQILESWL